MSSRYALQFQVGILGILLTFSLAWRRLPARQAGGAVPKAKAGARAIMAAIVVALLAGNGYTTIEEIKKAKLAYNFDHDLPIFFDEKLSEHILDGDRDQTY